jgi:hypothetical protein
MSAIPETDLSAVREYCANRIPAQHRNENPDGEDRP